VSFRIHAGESVGIIGATGCGKSTIARALTGLVTPHQGSMTFNGGALDFHRSPFLRRKIQMIFQDPYSALYPHTTIGAYLREAVRHHRLASRKEESTVIGDMLRKVGLETAFSERYPFQLSGGERQRVQIARALLIKPELLICDEITSGLDAAIQGQILQLLKDLRQETGMSLLVITHDLNVILFMAGRVLVMNEGRIVEEGIVPGIFSRPSHAITQALLKANAVHKMRKASE
jgi:ABC-type glutathione transport system ATPase component